MADFGFSADKVTIIVEADDKASSKLDSIGGKLDSLGGMGMKVAGAGLAGVGLAVGAVGGMFAAALPKAMTFQDQIIELGIASGDAGMSLDDLRTVALNVGSDVSLVGVDAVQAADGMTGLLKAGLSLNEVLGDSQGYLEGTAELGGALRASIDLAAASELDMVQASDLAAIALATFGGNLESESARSEFVISAMGNIVQAADASVMSVSDVGAALQNVGPIASALGIPLEDVNNMLAILSTRGITGSEAGTQLKSMFNGLQSDTPKVTEKLDELGVSLFDETGTMKGMDVVIGELQKSMAGMTDEQKNATAKTLAGSYGMAAFNTLLAEGTEGWYAQEEATAAATTMQEAAAMKTASLSEKWEALKGVFETFLIRVGTPVLDVITKLVDTFGGPFSDVLDKVAVAFEGIGTWVEGLITNFTDFGWTIEDLFTTFEDGSTVWDGFFKALGFGEETAQKLGTAINDIYQFVTNLYDKIVEVMTPILEWITANVELKDLLIALGIVIGIGVVSAIVAVITAIGPLLLLIAGLTAIVALARTAWEENWGGIQEKAAAVGAWLTENIPLIWNFIKDTITKISNAIRAFWDQHGEQIMETAGRVWNWIKDTIETIINLIHDIVVMIATNLQNFWNQHGETIMATASRVWNWIKTEIERLINLVRTIVETVSNAIAGFWEQHGEKIKETARAAYEWIKDRIEFFLKLIKGIFGLFKLAQEGKWYEFGQKLRTIVYDAFEEIKTVLSDAWEAIKTIFSEAIEIVKGWVSALVEDIKGFFTETDWNEIGGSIMDGIKKGIEDKIKAVANAVVAAARAILEAGMGFIEGESPSKLFAREIGLPIAQGIALGMEQGIPNLVRTTQTLLDDGTISPARTMFSAGASTGGTTINYNYSINANYAHQAEHELIQDIRILQMLRG